MWRTDRESSQSKPTAFMKSSFLKSILSKWPSMHSGSARPVGQTGGSDLHQSWHIQARSCSLLNMSYQVSTGAQLVLPGPYLGVGHRTGQGPLCGTPQSPSRSARTFCSRNSTKWAALTVLEHSSPQSHTCPSAFTSVQCHQRISDWPQ